MAHLYRLILFFALMLGVSYTGKSQTIWPSPEVEEMYQKAREFHAQGNIRQAIVMYQQAIQIAPNVPVLHRDLAHTYYLTGRYEEAKEVLEPLIKSEKADVQTFSIMAACLDATGSTKKAKNLLKKSIEEHPNSGMLYNELGKVYERDGEKVYALETWLDGIEADPKYHVNYYDAAHTYMYTNKMVWAILYGEMFLNMESTTPRAREVRKMVFAAYKRLYTDFASGVIPKFGSKRANANDFEQAVYDTYIKLSPVVADGITTENLIMLRSRFLIDWGNKYARRYPFSLFDRQDKMMRMGYFDMYNQWLFGEVENAQLFEAWKKFHPNAIPAYHTWANQYRFSPSARDYYNNKDVDDIFLKTKDKNKR